MKNILLLAMSTLGNIEKKNYYKYRGNTFIGRSQLEPITRMLCEERLEPEEKLDKIIILETQGTTELVELKLPVGDELLTVDFYKKYVRDCAGDAEYVDIKISAVDFYEECVRDCAGDAEYVDIEIDEDKPAKGIKMATSEILRYYGENNGEMRLWIDTQGGLRDVVMVFNAIISLLGEQGIEPEGIYSIKYNYKNDIDHPCPIVDQTEKYGIFRFVSAMQEFMDFGKATGLRRYYGEKNELVKCIGGIADAIQMCQPQEFEKSIKAFAKYLKSKQDKEEDPYLQIFVEFMKNDYGILLEQPDNTIEQIKWCVRKEFYQQAITIYIENMPKYYFANGMAKPSEEIKYEQGQSENPDAAAFYEGKFKEILWDKDDAKFKEILADAWSIADREKDNGCSAKQYLEGMKKGETLSDYDNVKEAIKRLTEYLENKYDDKGRIISQGTGKPIGAYIDTKFMDIIEKLIGAGKPGTIGKYLHTIKDNDKIRYFYIYEEEREDLGTYAKKASAVKKAYDTKKEDLADKMKYYLAVKLLRNSMNHASEIEKEKKNKKKEQDENTAIKFLSDKGITIGIEPENIKKILMAGVSLKL